MTASERENAEGLSVSRRDMRLIGGFDTEEQAKRIETEIEQFVGLDPAGLVRRHWVAS